MNNYYHYNQKKSVLSDTIPEDLKGATRDLRLFRFRLKIAKNTDQLEDAIQRILTHFGNFPEVLTPYVITHFYKSVYLTSKTIARIISDTHSQKLYHFYQSRLYFHDQVTVMKGGFYHDELEEKLCTMLLAFYENQEWKAADDGLKLIDIREIIYALEACGRQLALDVLDMIQDREPTILQKEITNVEDLYPAYFRDLISSVSRNVRSRLIKAVSTKR